MSTQPPVNDPRDIWQGQSQEQTNMSLHEFREKLRRLQSKSRRDSLKSLVIGLAVLGVFVAILVRTEAPLERFALGLFALGTLAAVFPHFIALWKGARRGNPAPDMAMTTGIEFYRRLLEPQRTYETGAAVCLLLIFFGLMLILLPAVSHQIENPSSRVSIRNILPFSIILIIWGVSFVVLRRRHQRWRRRELDQLSTLEKENR